MDLLSLPNEMLASVLKYTKHESLKRVRCLNSRMDVIARKNILDRYVIRHFGIGHKYGDLSFFEVEMTTEENFYAQSSIKTTTTRNLHKSENEAEGILDKILSKVRKIDSAILDNINIDEELIETMGKYPKLFRNSMLQIFCCKLIISTERLKCFANILKLRRIYLINCNFQDPLTDEIIIGFNPTMKITLRANDTLLNITAKSLYGRIHDNILKLSLGAKTSITFNDMIEFLKKNRTIISNMEFGMLCEVPKEMETIEQVLKSELGANDIEKYGVFIEFKPTHGGAELGYVKFQK